LTNKGYVSCILYGEPATIVNDIQYDNSFDICTDSNSWTLVVVRWTLSRTATYFGKASIIVEASMNGGCYKKIRQFLYDPIRKPICKFFDVHNDSDAQRCGYGDSYSIVCCHGGVGDIYFWANTYINPEDFYRQTKERKRLYSYDPTIWFQLEAPTCSQPRNNAVDVDVNIGKLSWDRKPYAYFHDVYFGNTAGSVANATHSSSGIYRGETSNSYWGMGILNSGTQYFWRVDPVGYVGFSGCKGSIWKFTTSEEKEPSLPQRAYCVSPTIGETGVTISTKLVWGLFETGVISRLYFGTDPGSLQYYESVTYPTRTFVPYSLLANTKYYWRIDTQNEVGITTGYTWSFTTASGLPPIPDMPWPVSPTNGATYVPIDITKLDWTDEEGADSYVVYFGTNPNPPLRGTITKDASGLRSYSSFSNRLQCSTKYYWTVRAVNNGRAIGTPTWSFTTSDDSPPLPPPQPTDLFPRVIHDENVILYHTCDSENGELVCGCPWTAQGQSYPTTGTADQYMFDDGCVDNAFFINNQTDDWIFATMEGKIASDLYGCDNFCYMQWVSGIFGLTSGVKMTSMYLGSCAQMTLAAAFSLPYQIGLRLIFMGDTGSDATKIYTFPPSFKYLYSESPWHMVVLDFERKGDLQAGPRVSGYHWDVRYSIDGSNWILLAEAECTFDNNSGVLPIPGHTRFATIGLQKIWLPNDTVGIDEVAIWVSGERFTHQELQQLYMLGGNE
jgi:hypothetical protein